VVVDGEFRRENWWIDFVAALKRVEIRDGDAKQSFFAPAANDHGHDHGWKYVPKNVLTTGRVHLDAPVNAADFAFLKSATTRTAKITLPSPTPLHFHGGRAAVSSQAYPDIEEFFADLAIVYQRETCPPISSATACAPRCKRPSTTPMCGSRATWS